MQSWLEGRSWVEKCAQATRMTASLRILSSKADSNTWESFTRSQCIKSHQLRLQTSSGKELPSHFWNRNIVRSILPGLRRRRTGLLLSGPKSSFQIKVHFVFHLEIKVPESGGREERHRIHVAWSPVWHFHSQWWFGLPCHLCWSTVFSEVHSQRSHLPGNFRVLHASFCWQALLRCWFHFPAGLGTCPHCQRYQSWFSDHGVTVLDWPANSPDLNPIENLDERHQTQQCRWPEGHCQSNLGFITPEQCHGLITSMPRSIDAVIHAKGGSTKYWVQKWTYFSEAWYFCLKYIFFIDFILLRCIL